MTTLPPILTHAVQGATIIRDREAPRGATTMRTAWTNTFAAASTYRRDQSA